MKNIICWIFGHNACNLEIADAAKDLSFIEVSWECSRCSYWESEELYTYKLNLVFSSPEKERGNR